MQCQLNIPREVPPFSEINPVLASQPLTITINPGIDPLEQKIMEEKVKELVEIIEQTRRQTASKMDNGTIKICPVRP